MSDAGQHDELPPHWSWHLALVGALALVVVALGIDPAAGGTSLQEAQRQIAQVGLGVLAVGFVVLWLLRRTLSADLRALAARFRDAPAEIAPARLIPPVTPPALRRVLWVAFVAWVIAVAVGLSLQAEWVADATFENGLLETATVLCYLAAAVFAGICARRLSRAGAGRGVGRWIYIALAAGCFLIAAEETDWGQTYLQYETPKAFEEANIQKDFSLHNLAPPSAVPGTRWANWLLRSLAWLGGGVLPLLIFASATVRRSLFALEFPVPPVWCMVMLFVSAWIPEFESLYIRNNVGSELREFSISVAIVVWLGSRWRGVGWAKENRA